MVLVHLDLAFVHLQVLSGDGRRKVVANFAKGLTEEQAKTMTKDMDGLKVKYTMPVKEGEPPHKRLYRVNGLKKAANKEIIADLGQTVEVYFKERYEVDIKYPNLQLLWVGSKHKTIYVPMEFCQMEKQPMPRKKKLPDDAIAKMIRFTAVKPQDRQKKIIDNLKKHNNKYQDDPYAREFGINVSGEMATLTGTHAGWWTPPLSSTLEASPPRSTRPTPASGSRTRTTTFPPRR